MTRATTRSARLLGSAGGNAKGSHGADGRFALAVVLNGVWLGLSGGCVHALRLAAHAAGKGNRTHLIGPAWIKDLSPVDVTGLVIDTGTRFDRRPKGLIRYVVSLAGRVVRSFGTAPEVNVVVAASHFLQDVVPAVVLGRRRNARVACFAYHLVSHSGRRSGGIQSWISRVQERASLAILRSAGATMFCDNTEVEQQLLRYGIPASRIARTANASGVPAPADRVVPEVPTVVSCGRLAPHKGTWDLVELAELLKHRMPVARVVIIGDGPLRPAVEQKVRARGLDNVTLTGFVTENEKWRRLLGSSVFVSASREEGWGIAVDEAVQAGLPTIVYDIAAYERLGDAVTRVPVDDVRALASEVVSALESPIRIEPVRRESRWPSILDADLEHLKALCT
jgi:glycosyltransferase involved in cell wall biosynthesis